jgi:uncharacterized membrane protein
MAFARITFYIMVCSSVTKYRKKKKEREKERKKERKKRTRGRRKISRLVVILHHFIPAAQNEVFFMVWFVVL